MEQKKTAGRDIAMTFVVESMLARLADILIALGTFKRDARIFPMSRDTFSKMWQRTVKRSRIKDLHFHDLRHEAASRFDEADLSQPQRLHMTGHTPLSQGDAQVYSQNKKILKKLEEHRWRLIGKPEPFQERWVDDQILECRGLTIEDAAGIGIKHDTAKGLVKLSPK
jgi:Phage integrase family